MVGRNLTIGGGGGTASPGRVTYGGTLTANGTLSTPGGLERIEAINAGRPPIAANDEKLRVALATAHERGNLIATTDERAYTLASVTLVDVPLDVSNAEQPTVRYDGLRTALQTLCIVGLVIESPIE